METTPYTIEIDAHAAYKRIGVDLKISPFAVECTTALKELLKECITTQMLTTALVHAAGGKRKRQRKSSEQSTPSKPQPGGKGDESEAE